MAKSGKTLKSAGPQAFDFSLATKRGHRNREREWVLQHSKTLRAEFQRLRDKIDWEVLRQALTEDQVSRALSGVDPSLRERLPNAAAILATVLDPKYPKLRPIPFLAESSALALQTNPKSADLYSPRYSRDICYKVRKQHGPEAKPMTDLEYWRGQDAMGMRVPVKYARLIDREEAKKRRKQRNADNRGQLTYVDIPEKMESVKKRRTTVWLPETMVARLKQLSAATGAPMAELFRRAVEAYLSRS